MNTPASEPKPAAVGAPGKAPTRRYGRMFVGWVLLPVVVAAALVASGIHQAAHHPEAWYTRLVAWFIQLG